MNAAALPVTARELRVTLPPADTLPRRLQLSLEGYFFRVMLYAPEDKRTLMYCSHPLGECYLAWRTWDNSTLAMGSASFELTPTEAERVVELFGARGLKVEYRR